MTRHTKASRREAFRRHCALPRHLALLIDAHRAADALFALIAGEPLEPGQMVTLGADGRVYRAVW